VRRSGVRNFIVQSDLKPANILVDANGVPKLLDFGIAKLLDPEQPEPAQTQGASMMTPDYASPEQILGRSVTSVSDVYSMGAVLYELLTGVRPHRTESCAPMAIERAVCLDPVISPSDAVAADRSLSRRLKGDLDNIVLRAMQKDPARRYRSAEHLAEDLQRYLGSRPVKARPDAITYRIDRFVRRDRLSVALGAATAIGVLTGAFVAGQEALLAHQRFQDVRKLATTFLSDIEDAVRPLPGSTRARQLIADTGVEYLTSLSRNSARNWELKRELANLGDPGSALVSFANAGGLLDEVLRHDLSDTKAAFDRMMVFYETSDVQLAAGRFREATASAEAGLGIAESLMARASKDPKVSDVVQYAGLLNLDLVRLRQQAGDLNGAESNAAAGALLLRQAAEAKPDNRQAQLSLADLDSRLGLIEAARGRRDDALANYRGQVSVLEALCRRSPSDTRAHSELMFAYGHVGDVLGSSNTTSFDNGGDLRAAFEAFGRMAEQAKFLYDADAADARSPGDYGIALLRLGRATPPAGPIKKQTLEHSRQLLNRAAADNPQGRLTAEHLMWVEIELGDYNAATARREKTMSGALDDPGVLRMLEAAVRPLAEEQARSGRRAQALATLYHSLRWGKELDVTLPPTSMLRVGVARAWQTAGSVYAILAAGETGQESAEDRAAARGWRQRALNEWRKIEHDKAFVPPFPAEMKAAEKALAAAS
jgi:hypothetical protein